MYMDYWKLCHDAYKDQSFEHALRHICFWFIYIYILLARKCGQRGRNFSRRYFCTRLQEWASTHSQGAEPHTCETGLTPCLAAPLPRTHAFTFLLLFYRLFKTTVQYVFKTLTVNTNRYNGQINTPSTHSCSAGQNQSDCMFFLAYASLWFLTVFPTVILP